MADYSTRVPVFFQKSLSIVAWKGLAAAAVLLAAGHAEAQRIVVPLNGAWSVGESLGAEEIPASFGHTVAVPGLVNQAKPGFPDVDQYRTWEYIWDAAFWNSYPKPPPAAAEIAKKYNGLGQTGQKRNYFWYQRTFTVPAKKQSSLLVINKAQFGTAVWLNGKKIGERLGCFTAGRFDVTDALRWEGENRLLVRIGAHPGVMPRWAPYGTDNEKALWTPGIYDAVSLQLADNPVIETVQVAPRISTSAIVVQTRLQNHGAACCFDMTYRLKTWKGSEAIGKQVRRRIALKAGEEQLVTQTVPVPAAILWSPDNPFLYVLDTSTGGDSCSTRFGMREFRCDASTGRAMLNGQVIYLRGSSFCLYRFFEDPKCGGLPWDEAWVRRLLGEIPQRLHWNAMRVCIGAVPQQWLDIADEAGLLLQYEFPIWSSVEPTRCKLWNEDEVTAQFREFLRDNWNHPSIVIWDAANETRWPFLKEKLIPAVRGLDLSHRPWEDSYVGPQGPDDPYEVHPYLMRRKPPFFEMTDLEQMKDGNDTRQRATGRLEVVWLPEAGDRAAAGSRQDYEVPALGQTSYDITLATPTPPGRYVLAAKAYWNGKPWSPTVARRKVTVEGPPVK